MKKFGWDILFMLIFLACFILVHKYIGASTAKNYWKAEDEANRKRLFGDAWDSLP